MDPATITTVMILTGILRHYAIILMAHSSGRGCALTDRGMAPRYKSRNNASAALSPLPHSAYAEDQLVDSYKRKASYPKAGPESRGDSKQHQIHDGPRALGGGMMRRSIWR